MPRYSMNRRDKKLAGVCATFGEVFNIDPTFLRIGLAATAILVSWQIALTLYVAGGIYLHLAKRAALKRNGRASDLERMEDYGRPRRTSVHELRTTLDVNDRRMMAIDHHLNRQNDELAREIEALRGDTK
jgi:phage shock protein PspC (stress-responsive transcriptional regulator)